MHETIVQILRDFSLEPYRPIIARDLDMGAPLPPRAGNLVKVITGMRRSGKSYRLFQEMDAVRAAGVPWDRICYFNFEDDRLAPITSATGDAVLEAFSYLHPGAMEQGAYLFFDELQEMKGWGSWLRRIVDTCKVTIYVSGSSSKMLSSEIATEFRGRALDFELLPYSFREYLIADARHASLAQSMPRPSTEEKIVLRRAFEDYLRVGGFPAAQGLPVSQATALLQSYVKRAVLRDVVERHSVARPRVATLFAQRLMGLSGKTLSLRKAELDLRSVGLPTSRELLSDLLAYFEEAYLLFQVREYSVALSERTTSTSKIYGIDPGLVLANTRANVVDEGQRLEQAVYLELRRRAFGSRADAITSCRTRTHGYEVDFVRSDAGLSGLTQLYQVSMSVDDERTRARELRALWELMEESGLEEGTLIVGRGEPALYEDDAGRVIRQVPAWSWMLEGGVRE